MYGVPRMTIFLPLLGTTHQYYCPTLTLQNLSNEGFPVTYWHETVSMMVQTGDYIEVEAQFDAINSHTYYRIFAEGLDDLLEEITQPCEYSTSGYSQLVQSSTSIYKAIKSGIATFKLGFFGKSGGLPGTGSIQSVTIIAKVMDSIPLGMYS
jgi:hypothetical protein